MPIRTAAEMTVSLQEITASTVRAVTDLRVAPEQEGYVASNAVSIAQAYFHKEAWFRSVHAGASLIGFVMLRDRTLVETDPPQADISLWRFMIDQKFQRSGYGREALALVVAHVRSRPRVKVLHTSYVEGPHGPKDFYLAFGFRHTGEIKPNGEVCLALDLE